MSLSSLLQLPASSLPLHHAPPMMLTPHWPSTDLYFPSKSQDRPQPSGNLWIRCCRSKLPLCYLDSCPCCPRCRQEWRRCQLPSRCLSRCRVRSILITIIQHLSELAFSFLSEPTQHQPIRAEPMDLCALSWTSLPFPRTMVSLPAPQSPTL